MLRTDVATAPPGVMEHFPELRTVRGTVRQFGKHDTHGPARRIVQSRACGHRRISLEAIEALGLDQLWWLVSPGNPLKDRATDMAPLLARLASARAMARRSRIVPTAIEAQFGTRYTVDTLRKLIRQFPNRRFIWVMGADNLAQFHLWRQWREIARMMSIAVIARPGYDGFAQNAPAMGWLRRFVRRGGYVKQWTTWSPPALVLLRFRPDPSSATRLRALRPGWAASVTTTGLRDTLSRRPLS